MGKIVLDKAGRAAICAMDAAELEAFLLNLAEIAKVSKRLLRLRNQQRSVTRWTLNLLPWCSLVLW